MRRRSLLAATVAAPVVLGLGLDEGHAAVPCMEPALPALILYDARLPVAERAAWHLHRGGVAARPTGGEIAALLLRERLFAAGSTILGLTGHAEYLLAQDIARMAGRQVHSLMPLGYDRAWAGQSRLTGSLHEEWRELLASLPEYAPGRRDVATAYAWLSEATTTVL